MGRVNETRQERRERERKLRKYSQSTTPPVTKEATPAPRKPFGMLLLATLAGAAITWIVFKSIPSSGAKNEAVSVNDGIATETQSSPSRRYSDLLDLSVEDVTGMDIAELNLLAGEGLPGTTKDNTREYLRELDQMTALVKNEIDNPDNFRRWQQNKPPHETSQNIYKMRVLVAALQNSCGIRYSDSLRSLVLTKDGNPPSSFKGFDREFYSNASNVFLHGLLSAQRQGTCVSMPVLYTAVARRLGYPVYLVMTKGHLFCRWHTKNEKFNVEGSGDGGMTPYPDSYYHTFPRKLSAWDLEHGNYLKSMSPAEELALFLKTRAVCLAQHQKHDEGLVAMAQAVRLTKKRHFPGLERQIAVDGFLPENTRRIIEDRILNSTRNLPHVRTGQPRR